MKNNDVEQMLLNNASLEELIKMKMENEFKDELKKAQEKPVEKVYTVFKDVPKEFIFSPKATYKYFNRHTKCETYVNGVQAESLIGLQNNVREKMLTGNLDAFTTEDAFVKFEKAVI